MAKSIIKGAGKLLGIGKKKAAEPAAVAEQKGPIIKQLGGTTEALDPRRRRTLAGLQGQIGTILSDKLGA
jgi:hypothetical protein